jgi:hypothetical protein
MSVSTEPKHSLSRRHGLYTFESRIRQTRALLAALEAARDALGAAPGDEEYTLRKNIEHGIKRAATRLGSYELACLREWKDGEMA